MHSLLAIGNFTSNSHPLFKMHSSIRKYEDKIYCQMISTKYLHTCCIHTNAATSQVSCIVAIPGHTRFRPHVMLQGDHGFQNNRNTIIHDINFNTHQLNYSQQTINMVEVSDYCISGVLVEQ